MVKDGLLYRAKILGQSFLQLVVPFSRREHVLKMGHVADTCQSSGLKLEFCIHSIGPLWLKTVVIIFRLVVRVS